MIFTPCQQMVIVPTYSSEALANKGIVDAWFMFKRIVVERCSQFSFFSFRPIS